MVVDTSALVAILFGEPASRGLAELIVADPKRLISAFTALETAVVVEARKGPAGGRELDLFLHRARFEVVPMTANHFELARQAYARFGKGRHPAGLNLGDCCSYALARSSGEPLLYVGEDFAKTDVTGVAR